MRHDGLPEIDSTLAPDVRRGAFVSIFHEGELRGCLGRLNSQLPIARLVAQLAQAVADSDPRFHRVTPQELDGIDLEISVLTREREIQSVEEIEIGRHGLIVEQGGSRGLLLPQVPTEHGWDRDDWPAIFERVMAADILVLTTPIWLGEKSSVCTHVIERLYGNSHLLNERGQYAYYGRVGGCLVTGNEDGIKHCAMNVLYSLQHLGYTIPPQADAGWIGEAGPGPSYLDDGSGGPDNDFTNRNTTFMTWNLLHLARMLKDAGGVPAHGNQRTEWDAGCRFAPAHAAAPGVD